MDEREKLLEQYDDAAFALMMDECAEAEGAAFLAEFRAAAEAGELPDFPEDLDQACRRTIDREYGRREWRARFRQLRRSAARAAVVVFALIGLVSTLVLSVEALRIPVLNFVIDHLDEFLVFNNGDAYQNTEVSDPLSVLLSDEYEQAFHSVSSDGYISSYYTTPDGRLFELISYASNSSGIINTEDAKCTEIMIAGIEVQLFENDELRVIWLSCDGTTVYSVRATGMNKDTFLEVCTDLITTFEM